MADYNLKLSQFHQRVWQDEIGLSATIEEHGWIQFGRTTLGELTIYLREYSPEGMNLQCTIFEDFTDKAPAEEIIRQVCDNVNKFQDAKLTASGATVHASIYLILAAPGRIPDEGLLRAVIGPAISRIKAAATQFVDELPKLTAAQRRVNDHLSSLYRSGMTADALFESYTSSPEFGEDRCIVVSSAMGDFFPAYGYARQRCNQMCGTER